MMERVTCWAVMLGSLVLLGGCLSAYPGPGKTEAQLKQDVWNCTHFPHFTIERCLVAAGDIVKRPDGAMIYPSLVQTVPQFPVAPRTVSGPDDYVGPSPSSYVAPGEIDPATVAPPPPAP